MPRHIENEGALYLSVLAAGAARRLPPLSGSVISAGLAGIHRNNVLVDVKEIVRVVRRFHRRQPFVIGTIVGRRTIIIVAGHEVDVTALAARIRMNGFVTVFIDLKGTDLDIALTSLIGIASGINRLSVRLADLLCCRVGDQRRHCDGRCSHISLGFCEPHRLRNIDEPTTFEMSK